MIQDLYNIVIEKFGEQMKQTPQSPIYHGEGDVYTHIMMVYDVLKTLPEYMELTENQQKILSLAALMHDIGKISTTIFKDGDWHSPHHAIKGSKWPVNLCSKIFLWVVQKKKWNLGKQFVL